MVEIEELVKKIKSIKSLSIRNLNEQEKLLILLYKTLLELNKKYRSFPRSSSKIHADVKNFLSRFFPKEIAKELAPLLGKLGRIEIPNLYDFLLEIEKRKIHLLHPCYPYEILELGMLVLEPEENTTIYNPYPDAYGFAYWFSKHKNASVFTKDPYETEIPVLLNESLNSKIKYSFKEPLCDEEKKFDYSISFVWKSKQVSVKCNGKEVKDWSEVLILKHLLSVTRKKIVVFLPSSFITRIRSNFSSIRKDILQYLKSVILLPGNIFYNTVSSYCMLILDLERFQKHSDNQILLIDASSFFEVSDFGRKNILKHRKILEILKDKKQTEYSVILSSSQVERFDEYCRLHPRLYLKENLKFINLTNRIRKINLGSLVGIIASPFIRNTLKQSKGKELQIFELQITDIPEDGIIKRASLRKRKIFNKEEYSNSIVRPGDILLSVRGVIGKVGFVFDVPKDEIWIPSQTLVILRPKPEKMDPLALFVFLRSKLGQFLIESAKSGEALDYIPIKTLSNIEIPNFNEQQQNLLREFFVKEREYYSLIEETRKKIKEERERIVENLINSN